MSRSVQTAGGTNTTGAIAVSRTCNPGEEILGLLVRFNTAPTTAGNLTVTLNSIRGATYDTVLFSIDPASVSATSIVWSNDGLKRFAEGDAIDIAYANADNRTYGVSLYFDSQPLE